MAGTLCHIFGKIIKIFSNYYHCHCYSDFLSLLSFVKLFISGCFISMEYWCGLQSPWQQHQSLLHVPTRKSIHSGTYIFVCITIKLEEKATFLLHGLFDTYAFSILFSWSTIWWVISFQNFSMVIHLLFFSYSVYLYFSGELCARWKCSHARSQRYVHRNSLYLHKNAWENRKLYHRFSLLSPIYFSMRTNLNLSAQGEKHLFYTSLSLTLY